MPDSILLLLVFAALGHAVWNALSRKVAERDRFFTLIVLIAVILYSPLAAHLFITTGYPAKALIIVAGSTLFEIAYFICLGKAYQKGTFLAVYPVARGSSPLITTVISSVLFWKFVGYPALIGIMMVVAGILFINQDAYSVKQLRTTFANPGTRWALLTGFCTASYSVFDSMGAAIMSPVLFIYTVFVGLSIGKLIIDHFSKKTNNRHPYISLLKMHWHRAIIGGFLVFGVSAVVVYAMQSTFVALVATVREISIVFASLIGIIWLKEQVSTPKIISIILIVGGVLLIRG